MSSKDKQVTVKSIMKDIWKQAGSKDTLISLPMPDKSPRGKCLSAFTYIAVQNKKSAEKNHIVIGYDKQFFSDGYFCTVKQLDLFSHADEFITLDDTSSQRDQSSLQEYYALLNEYLHNEVVSQEGLDRMHELLFGKLLTNKEKLLYNKRNSVWQS